MVKEVQLQYISTHSRSLRALYGSGQSHYHILRKSGKLLYVTYAKTTLKSNFWDSELSFKSASDAYVLGSDLKYRGNITTNRPASIFRYMRETCG